MTQTVILRGDAQREFAQWLIEVAPDDAVVHISDAEKKRTDAQNRLVHRWFADISRALGDETEVEVKARCNLIYGKPILARDDPEWAAAFGYVFEHLEYRAKIKAIRVFDIPFTRRMNVKQLTEYMDAMRRDYAEQGIHLTDPEARKYEQDFG